MTPRELAICRAFKNVSFQLGSSHKRFARDMMHMAEHAPEKELTAKQATYLAQVAYKYRRQMPSQLAYPAIDDGSWMAAQGYEGTEQAPIERPLSVKDARKKMKALQPPDPQQALL